METEEEQRDAHHSTLTCSCLARSLTHSLCRPPLSCAFLCSCFLARLPARPSVWLRCTVSWNAVLRCLSQLGSVYHDGLVPSSTESRYDSRFAGLSRHRRRTDGSGQQQCGDRRDTLQQSHISPAGAPTSDSYCVLACLLACLLAVCVRMCGVRPSLSLTPAPSLRRAIWSSPQPVSDSNAGPLLALCRAAAL